MDFASRSLTLRARHFTGEHGHFEFAQVPDGRFTLEVELSEGLLRGATQRPPLGPHSEVAAGATDVALVVDAGQELAVLLDVPDQKVYTSRGLPGPLAKLWLKTGEGITETADAFVRDGVARFRGLRADPSYSLWVAPDDEGALVFQHELHAGTTKVVRRPGREIRVTIKAPPAASKVGASALGPFFTLSAEHSDSSARTLVLSGVPEGTWRVSAYALIGKKTWVASGRASAGASIEIEVAPRSVAGEK